MEYPKKICIYFDKNDEKLRDEKGEIIVEEYTGHNYNERAFSIGLYYFVKAETFQKIDGKITHIPEKENQVSEESEGKIKIDDVPG